MELTKAGLERRARMLRELQAATVQVARRRVVLRRAMLGTGCVVFLALAAALSGTGGKPVSLFAPGGPLPGVAIAPLSRTALSARTVTPRRAVRLEVVHNDPGILLRHAAVEATIDPGTFIGDDDLLAILEAADRPAGLIRRDGLVEVTPDVADVRF
ncbi:MAG TPA: hypothetical protein VMT52_09565 [Planctomycetota bacterium]|nr:hypothetical protein [Planctomycetota bacterium]